MTDILINTLVYQKQLDNHEQRQSDLISSIAALGVAGVEARREYFFPDDKEDMRTFAAKAAEAGLDVYYSVPDTLFVAGKVNEHLERYVEEAASIHAKNIKLNIGQPKTLDDGIKNRIEQYIQNSSIRLTIENDQSMETGRLSFISGLLDQMEMAGIPVGFTFDMGNWCWPGEDPLTAARQLGKKISVFHLKNVLPAGHEWQMVPVDEGMIPWKQVLQATPPAAPVIIEYPLDGRALVAADVRKVRDYLNTRSEGRI